MKERQLYRFIKETIERNGESPTVDEMTRALGLNSKSALYRNLNVLETEGFIRRRKGWRGIELAGEYDADASDSTTRIPLLGLVAAGNPIEAVLVPEYLNAPRDMLRPGNDHFALRVVGDSMIEEKILEGDRIVVRASPTANNGDIVVALVDGRDATVKTFRVVGDKIHLIPANSRYRTIVVDAERVTVQGIVVGLLRYFA
jgi:repressor LexA